MIRLLGRATSGNVQKVIFLLEEAGIPYAREDYGRQFGNTQTPDYRALNPNAKVPTLIDGKTVIWESNTIPRYLAAAHAPHLHGATPTERAEVERWMDWLLASVNPHYVSVFLDSRKPQAERAPDFAAQGKALADQMVIAEGHMEGRPWLALDRLTLADVALGPIFKRCLTLPTGRGAMPNLEAWQARLEEHPAFRTATAA